MAVYNLGRIDGLSAYEVAQKNGYEGTEKEWLASLKGEQGEPGQEVSSNPIGTVIPFMGTTAPTDYLICNGAIYNITDYPKLANHFETQFGSKNYFGGDGTTTFAVPDLRNEFIRGYGDLSGEIGKHQDATEHPTVWSWNYGNNTASVAMNLRNTNSLDIGNISNNEDTQVQTIVGRTTIEISGNIANNSTELSEAYTSRPTNVAVLFCIKY